MKMPAVLIALVSVLALTGAARAVEPYCAEDDVHCEEGLRHLRESFGGKSGREIFDGAAARRDGAPLQGDTPEQAALRRDGLELIGEEDGVVLRREKIEHCRGGGRGGHICHEDTQHLREIIGNRQTLKIIGRDAYVKKEQKDGTRMGALIGGGVGLLAALLLMGPLGLAAAAVGIGAAGAGAGIGALVGRSEGRNRPDIFTREEKTGENIVPRNS